MLLHKHTQYNIKVFRGFTLVELVMVIIIISVLAAGALPKLINLKTRAIEKSEDAIMGALSSAIKAKQMENIASGMTPEAAWPGQDYVTCPFTLLAQAPPYLANSSWAAGSQDNVNWRTISIFWNWPPAPPSIYIWAIVCPHWNGNMTTFNDPATKGRYYVYTAFGAAAALNHPQGDLWNYTDHGH